MRYAQLRSMDIVNGKGVGVALFTSGCPIHCKNCFNAELWDMNGGKLWTDEEKTQLLEMASPNYVERLSILGGEPMIKQNEEALYDLVRNFKEKYPNKKIWLYSGYTWEYLINIAEKRKILEYVDILVDGKFEDELKDFRLKFKGSSNQRVIDVQESIRKKGVVLANV